MGVFGGTDQIGSDYPIVPINSVPIKESLLYIISVISLTKTLCPYLYK